MGERPDAGEETSAGGPPADPAMLEALRAWAWERGRTDVIGRLDLARATSGFCCSLGPIDLLRLAALLPVATVPDSLGRAIRDLSRRPAAAAERVTLAGALGPWLAALERRLADDVAEMAGGPP